MKTSNKILLAVGILLTAFLIYYQLRFQHFKIASTSMYSSLLVDDILLFDKHFDALKANDVVAFNTSFIDAPVCSRIIGLPNDNIEIKDAVLYVNGVKTINKYLQYEYSITSDVVLNEQQLLKRKILLEPFRMKDEYGNFSALLNDKNLQQFSNIKGVKSVEMIIHPKSYQYLNSELAIFPNHENYNWSRDNFGEITVPKMGETIELNATNLPLYTRVIEIETNKSLAEIMQLKIYTFKNDYYFLMSDNRHNALDSRYFGFISKNDIIGVYSSTIYSPN